MPRRRIRIVLAGTALAVIAAASGFAGLWVGATTGEDSEPGAWSLLGVRDGGRTLVVQGPEHSSCDRASVRVDESRPDRVTIRSQVHTPRGSYDCTADLRGGKEFSLRLSHPIVGRAVVGKRRKLPQAKVSALETDYEKYVNRSGVLYRPFPVPGRAPPNVVGLRFRDARHALCNAGLEARRPQGSARTGMVVAQRAPVVQRLRDPPQEFLTCTNGLLPAVDLEVRAR